jgi:hypothetical protein
MVIISFEFVSEWLSIMTSLLEWKIMFTGLGELGGQGPLEWPTHSLVTRMQSMLQISSKFWKGQISRSLQRYVIWLHVVVGGWEGLDVGALALAVMMGGAVDAVILVMVEGVVGECPTLLLADQKEVEAVEMTMSRGTGTLANLNSS